MIERVRTYEASCDNCGAKERFEEVGPPACNTGIPPGWIKVYYPSNKAWLGQMIKPPTCHCPECSSSNQEETQ